MKFLRMLFLMCLIWTVLWAQSQGPGDRSVEDIRSGKSFIRTTVYAEQDDMEILRLFKGLRVADVSDGMDKSGLHSIGLVDPEILPLWKDAEHFTHRIVGIAVTARYVSTQRPPAGQMDPAQFDMWESRFYTEYSSEPFADLIRKGTVLVIDDAENSDVGSIGSYNIMDWASRGCVGVVTDSSARDTDEIIAVKIPLYLRKPGRGIRPGRNEIESVNRPVEIGGVLVMPGDVVVADGDGVVVVPRKHAKKVALFAREIMEKDKDGRRVLYKKLGLPLDESILSYQPRQESVDTSFQKGMAFPTWIAGQYCMASSDESLRILAQTTCTEYVQLVPTWYQEDRFSNAMHPDFEGNTARMDCLRHAIQTARNFGLKVMLKPHVDASSGDWRGTFQPENPETWFSNYTEMMKTFAQLAQEENVDILSVGCEFVELTTSDFTQAWKELIQAVRKVYDGPLIYAANWGRESLQVEFWDALDFIGIDAYFELTNNINPTVDELLEAWMPYVLEVESFHQVWKKPVVITEIGYRSLDGANMRPWDWQASGEVDLVEQALCYQAVIRVFGDKPWFGGVYWWNWEPDPSLGGTADNGYTPQGKPAEAILKMWYCQDSLHKKGIVKR